MNSSMINPDIDMFSHGLEIQEYSAQGSAGEMSIAPTTPGDIHHQYIDGDTFFVKNNAFIACTKGIRIESRQESVETTFFADSQQFLLRCSGVGDLWFHSYGSLLEIGDLKTTIVSAEFVVAFSESLSFTQVSLVDDLVGYRFSGKGLIWIENRSKRALTEWLHESR